MAMVPPSVPNIFDPRARAIRHAAQSGREPGFFATLFGDDLIDRVDALDPIQGPVLIAGEIRVVGPALEARGMAADHVALPKGDDALDLPSAHYGLILSTGLLDRVDDLPGVLVQMRRALRPGGRLVANLVAAPSLTALRAAASAADAEQGQGIARFHPLVDVRTAGDLLARTGFAEPVADSDTLRIAYADLGRLLGDLRAGGLRNLLNERHAATRAWRDSLHDHFSAAAADGRTYETISWVTLSGRAPS